MVKRACSFTLTDQKIIERVFEDEHTAINHMVLRRGDALPEHTVPIPTFYGRDTQGYVQAGDVERSHTERL